MYSFKYHNRKEEKRLKVPASVNIASKVGERYFLSEVVKGAKKV